jgi:hypothetical protein
VADPTPTTDGSLNPAARRSLEGLDIQRPITEDPDYKDHPNYYAWIGGSFEPFSAEEFAKRYPSREVYAELVRKAAAALLAERFILQEDYDAYIQSAELHRW